MDIILDPLKNHNMILAPAQDKGPTPQQKGEPIAIILLPGCQLKPEQYRGVAQEIQSACKQDVWVAVPKLPLDMANPLVAPTAAKDAFLQLKEQGYSGDKVFLGGHSLGGVFLPWVLDDDRGLRQDQVAGVVQLGSFQARGTTDDAPILKIPSLTLTGDLDGMVRASRIAEDYHSHVLAHREGNTEANKLHHSVVLIEGMNHFGFVQGETPLMKKLRDLPQEIGQDEAIQQVASTIAAFIDTHQTGCERSKQALLKRIDETAEYLQPLLTALELEGSQHVRSDPSKGSPWAKRMQKELLPDQVKAKVTRVSDKSRPSWYLNPFSKVPFFHPKVKSLDDGSLELESYSDPIYEKTDACFDGGFFSNTVHELRCKFNSPQAVLQAATGDSNVPFVPADNFARDLNQKTIDWAFVNAPARVKRRYQRRGIQLIPGDDIAHNSGPSWIWSYMNFERQTRDRVIVRSHTMATSVNHPIPAAGGKLYCKLLSPAKALDWMYTDSLRSTENVSNPVAGLVGAIFSKMKPGKQPGLKEGISLVR